MLQTARIGDHGSERGRVGGAIRRLASVSLLAWACWGCTRDRPPSGTPPEPPHSLLLVTLDTTRIDHLGAYGSHLNLTPNLDALAAEGVTVTAARTQIPITLAAHTSIMTGLSVLEHGIHENGSFVLGESVTTLAEVLAARGYRTAAFVSAFVLDRRFGIAQGFATYDDHMTSLHRDHWQGHDVGYFERPADATTARARAWLEELDSDRPFFLWVHYFDPHSPYQAPPEYASPGRAPYASEIAFADAEFGELVAAARRTRRKLLVAVASDHGESLGEHSISGHGRDLFEPALRTVLLFQGQDRLPRGERRQIRCTLQDISATLLDLLDFQVRFPGRPLFPEEGTPAARDPIYLETLLPALRFNRFEVRGWIRGDWKLVQWTVPGEPGQGRVSLFHIADDPGELHDLSAEQPDRVRAMSRELRETVEQARRNGSASEAAEVDEETLRKLRALGYAG